MNKICLTLNNKQYLSLIFILGTVGVISLIAGLYNAWNHMVDFQQPASCLFISGKNPYLFDLERIHPKNWAHPNYLHPLYILLSPLCLFDDSTARLIWGLINSILAIWIAYTLCKMANYREYFLLITFFFFASLPFRNGIGNGQNQILILTFFLLSIQANSSWLKGLFGSLSFIKYSFAGSWIGMNICHDKYSVIWSGVFITFMMLCGAFWISSGNFLTDFLGPFKVAAHGVSPGTGDLLTIFDNLFIGQYQYKTIRTTVGVLLLVINIVTVAWITRKSTNVLFNLSIAGVASLMFVTHLGYDDVFLFPALVFLIVKGGRASLFGLIAISYSWQVVKVLAVLNLIGQSLGWIIIQFCMYTIVLTSLIISEKKDEKPLLILPTFYENINGYIKKT